MFFKSTLVATTILVACFDCNIQAAESHEDWLKFIEGTWTWDDEVRGKVTITFEFKADGKCVVGMGKDDTGTFVSIIGWEAATKSFTDTSFHSNGGGGRIVYNKVNRDELEAQLALDRGANLSQSRVSK
ncbi:MAG: hypothetical protein NXI32_30140 [bacterium]|nr:hypothetical protein [bacterium]